jgi:hypothetical protein
MAERLKLSAQMVRANAGLHADQTRRQVGKPHNHLATGQFAAQNDVLGAIEPDEVEVVLANIDADRRHSICRFAGHGSCSFCYPHPKSQGASRSTVGPSHWRKSPLRSHQPEMQI